MNSSLRLNLIPFIIAFLFGYGSWSLLSAQSQEILENKDILKCERLAMLAEKKYQLPKNILLSIARVESGYRKFDGVTRSWPWTLNAGGDSAYFETKEDAIKDLKSKLKVGRTNIDLGCMQINYKWHKKFFVDVSEMMEPTKNVEYGARFLKRLFKRHGSWDQAVKFYHSSKSRYNKIYLKKVKAVWNKENKNKNPLPLLLANLQNKVNDQVKLDTVKVIPIVKLATSKKRKPIVKIRKNNSEERSSEPVNVSVTNFENINLKRKDFNFRSFVKRVSKENSEMPKYIRDNWTFVVSIRNQLRDQK
jgi:hypothetical protein